MPPWQEVSHKSQPWRAEVYPNDSILVFADATRLLTVVDPSGAELFILVVALIENRHILARIGYVSDYPAPVSKRRPLDTFVVFK